MGLSSLIVAFDQLTKWAIVRWLRQGDIPVEINSFLFIVRRHNEGAAWSFLADAGGWQRWFFVVLSSNGVAHVGHWLWSNREEGNTILSGGLVLVLGGAVGNLVDRIHYGYVVDFIDVYFSLWNYHFPAFNVADSAITIGAVLLVVDALFISGRKT